jgi:hypothetical protein
MFLKHKHRLKSIILTALFVMAICLGVSHHHEDGASHGDCAVCVVAARLSVGSVTQFASLVFHPVISLYYAFEETIGRYPAVVFPYPGRAPPASRPV